MCIKFVYFEIQKFEFLNMNVKHLSRYHGSRGAAED
jgi:hypothetical protein